jgi:hypothetical protein
MTDIWDKTKEGVHKAWDKTKELGEDAAQKTKHLFSHKEDDDDNIEDIVFIEKQNNCRCKNKDSARK